MRIYELTPITAQKSFYGKAIVVVDDDGSQTLFSYDTPIIKRLGSRRLVKLWNGWSYTTGKHIRAFCGLNKAEFMKLQ